MSGKGGGGGVISTTAVTKEIYSNFQEGRVNTGKYCILYRILLEAAYL